MHGQSGLSSRDNIVSDNKIESILNEQRSFPPPQEFIDSATIKAADLEALYAKAATDYQGYWGDLARETIQWQQPFDQILDESSAPNYAWFRGGTLNVSYNCLDIHLESRGDKTAIIFEGEEGDTRSLSYAELTAEVCRFANALKASGMEAGDRIVIYMPMVPEAVIAMQACARIGAIHSVVFGGFSASSLRDRIEDAGARAVITADGGHRGGRVVELKAATDKALAGGCATIEKVFVLKRSGQEINMQEGRDLWWADAVADQSAECQPTFVDSEHPLFLLYTSGSTGKPKGVLVEHGNVARLMSATDKWFGFGAQDTWTLFHSYAFDFTVWELWGSLAYGGKLVIVPYLISRSFTDFYQLLVDEQVTVLNQTPSAFAELVRVDADKKPDALQLRYVIFGGEALDPQLLRPWFERHGDTTPQLINMFGITETTVHVTYRPLTRHDCSNTSSAIGTPIPDLYIYLLDENLKPVPNGIAGEMYVGGAGLARGYLNRPELTAERFIDDPFAPNKRLYRTGDLARFRQDGELEYLGRADDQVKLRGFRIELGEIEAALHNHPDVDQSVVTLREDTPGDLYLAAYFVASKDQSPNTTSLREHLLCSLPDYMVPAAFVSLAELPLTPNGKIDRKALPVPQRERDESQAFVTPRNEVEQTIATIWQDVLGIDEVGVHDDFFRLGGHSLVAMQLVSRIMETMRVELPLDTLFNSPTIAGLAETISNSTLATGKANEIKIISRSTRRTRRPR